MNQPIKFSKLSGTGNDFILIDNRDKSIDTDICKNLVVSICRRAVSVGADGVIFIENDPKGECDFKWRFFNADGSEAEMCGNGGRCAARFAFERGIAGPQMTFVTLAGVISAQIIGKQKVKIQLTKPENLIPLFDLEIDSRTWPVRFLDTGVPHTVIEVADIESVNVFKQGGQIRNHPRFAPKGTNANFVQIAGPNRLLIRTFERGVEGETLACGTGAVAAAITLALENKVAPPVSLLTRSGEELVVHFDAGAGLPEEVYLEGAARWIYDAVLSSDAVTGR